MTCPQCDGRVPAKTLWTSTGPSGIVCPQCRASLYPKALCAIVVFALCIGLGEASMLILQWHGANFAIGLLAFFFVFAAVFALAAPIVLKLRVKDGAHRSLAGKRA
jgi:hypothetical protein